jgi:FOG: Glucan-binding domain (YG repeat)
MHRKVKYIIAASLVIGAVSGFLPINNSILGTTKAYAATYSGASNGELSSVTLTRSDGNEVELRSSYTGDSISLSGKNDYYVNLKGDDGVDLSADVKGSGYVVKVFESGSKTEKGKNADRYIRVDSTYTDIYLRTYKSEDAYNEAYNDGDVSNCEETYVIHVKKDVTTDSETEENKDYAYLRSIYLSDGTVDFSKKKMSYDINVDENVEEILVRATPDNDDDLVEINDSSLNKDDNYEKTISLNKGNNTIKIYVTGNEDDETYTLNVYRGKKADASSSSTIGTDASTGAQTFKIENPSNQYNVWKPFNGKWKYIDGTGQALKDQWWFDKNNGMNYYLDKDGFMATGWLNNNGNWYYFNQSGEMQTGWICIDKNWYYLNKSGVMKMGWLEDSTGNWYYLDNSGAMKTGWVDSDGKWYYLDATGKMAKDSIVNGYKLDTDGVLMG